MFDCHCLINSCYKKISYPFPVIVEPLFRPKLPPLQVVTNELKPAELLLYITKNKKPELLYKIENLQLIPLYGIRENSPSIIVVNCKFYYKIEQINNIILHIFSKFTVNELINYQSDFEDFENHIKAYFLRCKTKSKIELRRIRSLCFRSFKSPSMAEKIFNLMDLKFNEFDNRELEIEVNLDELSVQYLYE